MGRPLTAFRLHLASSDASIRWTDPPPFIRLVSGGGGALT